MDMRIPPLEIKILLESNPLKSRSLVWRLAACVGCGRRQVGASAKGGVKVERRQRVQYLTWVGVGVGGVYR